MALLVQAYLGVSDSELIQLTKTDLRVQMVLDCLGATKAPFSQGALVAFRDRLILGEARPGASCHRGRGAARAISGESLTALIVPRGRRTLSRWFAGASAFGQGSQ